jgi:hypothetical protein
LGGGEPLATGYVPILLVMTFFGCVDWTQLFFSFFAVHSSGRSDWSDPDEGDGRSCVSPDRRYRKPPKFHELLGGLTILHYNALPSSLSRSMLCLLYVAPFFSQRPSLLCIRETMVVFLGGKQYLKSLDCSRSCRLRKYGLHNSPL